MPRRYDDDYDDFDDSGRRRGPVETPSAAGMLGFIAAAVSAGLLVVVAVLYYALELEEQQREIAERTRLMLYWFLVLDIFAFFASLAAIILSSRGLSPSNPLYRGWAMTGLILGIIELILTLIFGLVMTCGILLFEVNHGGG
jgi:hypothetical protein